VLSVHFFKNSVTTGLHRQVNIIAYVVELSHGVYDIQGHVLRV
jgi:hypothetical protein